MAKDTEGLEGLIPQIDRESALVLDREGRFFHDGLPVEHQRLVAALHRWIDRDPETGRFVIRVGQQWCFFTVEDAPFQILGVSVEPAATGQTLLITLDDGSEEELSYGSLRQRANNVLYCDVKGGRFKARFSRNAYYKLAQLVELEGDEPRLIAAGRSWPITLEPDEVNQ
jgi:hypothetical protein